jgi:hypothetical protein
VERLGRGGFGEVWKALGPSGFHVALKFVGLGGRPGVQERRALEVIDCSEASTTILHAPLPGACAMAKRIKPPEKSKPLQNLDCTEAQRQTYKGLESLLVRHVKGHRDADQGRFPQPQQKQRPMDLPTAHRAGRLLLRMLAGWEGRPPSGKDWMDMVSKELEQAGVRYDRSHLYRMMRYAELYPEAKNEQRPAGLSWSLVEEVLKIEDAGKRRKVEEYARRVLKKGGTPLTFRQLREYIDGVVLRAVSRSRPRPSKRPKGQPGPGLLAALWSLHGLCQKWMAEYRRVWQDGPPLHGQPKSPEDKDKFLKMLEEVKGLLKDIPSAARQIASDLANM